MGSVYPCKIKKQPKPGGTSKTEEQKLILLSDKLWLIANNSKSSANGNKSEIRNNLRLYKHWYLSCLELSITLSWI